jgi:hypothetical protein
MGGNALFSTLKNIDKYISEDFDNNEEDYVNISITDKILRLIAHGLHKNMYYIGIVVVLFSNLISMNNSLTSVRLKQIMSAIIVPLIGVMAVFISGNGKNSKNAVPTETPGSCDNLKKPAAGGVNTKPTTTNTNIATPAPPPYSATPNMPPPPPYSATPNMPPPPPPPPYSA